MQAVPDIADIGDRELIQALLDSPGSHAIVVTDIHGKVFLWNRGAARIFGYSAEEMVGTTADRLFTPEDREHDVIEQEMHKALTNGCAGDFRWHMRKSGDTFWGDGMMYPFFSNAGQHLGYMKIVRDATEQKLREDRHAHLAYVDTLTGLPNRAEFHRRLADMTASAQRHDELLFLHLVDLDHFKQINDNYGHPVGDQVLQEFARRCQCSIRDVDLVGRYGGEELLIFLPETDSKTAMQVAERLRASVEEKPMIVSDQKVNVTVSIGVSGKDENTLELETLIARADQAMYIAKHKGRNCVAISK